MPAPKKYATDVERRRAYMEQQNNYSKRKTVCDVCHMTFNLGNKTKHLRSFGHINIQNDSSGI
jgi:hypothetical protein